MHARHKSGQTISVRDLSAGDEPALRAMFGRLGRETVYKRFQMPFPRVPDPMLAHLMKYGDGRSLVAIAGGEIVGHAMYVGQSRGEAEVAIVVEDGWQSGGIGKLLLAGLARRAAGRGVEAFTGVALGENRRVLGLVDAVFAGASHTLKGGSYEIFMPLRGLRSPSRPGREIQPAA